MIQVNEEDYARLYQRVHGVAPPMTLATAKAQKGKVTVDYAAVLLTQIIEAALTEPALAGQWFREFTFHESRNWRLDVACPARKLCIEVDGMVHRIRKRFLGDIEKHNALTFDSWTYLRVTPEQVRTGQALELVRAFVTKGNHDG